MYFPETGDTRTLVRDQIHAKVFRSKVNYETYHALVAAYFGLFLVKVCSSEKNGKPQTRIADGLRDLRIDSYSRF